MKCPSCSGDNKPNAAQCVYCGATISGRKEVEIAWQATTGEGVSGKGHVSVSAPVAEAGERVRNLVEAAFSAAVDEVGADAKNDAIEQAMSARLEALLPEEHDVTRLTLESYKRPGHGTRTVVVKPRKSTALLLLGVMMILGGVGSLVCCGCFGGGLMLGSVASKEELAKLKTARIVTVEEAATASGLIAIENVIPETDETLTVADTDIRAIVVDLDIIGDVATDSSLKNADRVPFRIGQLEVDPALAKLEKTAELHRTKVDGKTHVYRGIRADQPITVVGQVSEGTMRSGLPFIITTQPSLKAMEDEMASLASGMQWFGIAGIAVSPLLLILGIVVLIKR